MSINNNPLDADDGFPTHDPHARLGPSPPMATLHCRGCGFEPEDAVAPPRACPRCLGGAFERVPVPRSLLAAATRPRRSSPRGGDGRRA